VQLPGHAAELERGDVPGREHAQHAPVALDDRQVAEAAPVHAPDRLLDRLVGADGPGIGGHDLAQRRAVRVEARGHDAHQQVALGEDAEHAAAPDDQEAAAAGLGHAPGAVAGGRVGAGGDQARAEAAAVEDGADGASGHGGGLSLMPPSGWPGGGSGHPKPRGECPRTELTF
jgi:hypothetical protein